jgi:hypothetical protein
MNVHAGGVAKRGADNGHRSVISAHVKNTEHLVLVCGRLEKAGCIGRVGRIVEIEEREGKQAKEAREIKRGKRA